MPSGVRRACVTSPASESGEVATITGRPPSSGTNRPRQSYRPRPSDSQDTTVSVPGVPVWPSVSR
ncbi:hypothetical protein [Nonomuraea harbinensis]|uniref:Uncharacterized protein n=1 Tax=Nonomuraea harbinensis TaxID=1286938 RepID=A0ABW1BN70_9ACTN|nr:hypothetical protein [Nonomuraea harbinensis]